MAEKEIELSLVFEEEEQIDTCVNTWNLSNS